MKRLRIGDIIEIKTARGLSYAQLSHKHPVFGTLLRVLPGFHTIRPSAAELRSLAQTNERFFVFVPADAAVAWRKFVTVDHADVPEHARPFPMFKAGFTQPGEVRVDSWRLWDGERELPIMNPTDEQLALPILEVVSPDLLIRRIEADWTPATDTTITGESSTNQDPDIASPQLGEAHYLYFTVPSAAEKAARRLLDQALDVEVRRAEGSEVWLVLVRVPRIRSTVELEETQRRLERLAAEFGGEYDGWEAAV